jgi:uncharacterized protein
LEYRDTSASSRIVFWTFGFVVALYGAWIGAWLLEEALVHQYSWLATDAGQFAYWTFMKLALWVVPALVLIRLSGRRIRTVFAFGRWRSALLWGGGVGLVLGASAVLPALLRHQPLLSTSVSWAFVNAVVVAPIVEELTFRGAVLGGLSKRYRFAVANTLTALFFLGAHLPGWYFQGQLWSLLVTPVGGALSIFVIGWLLGFVMYRSQSLLGSTLAHMLNNLFNAL